MISPHIYSANLSLSIAFVINFIISHNLKNVNTNKKNVRIQEKEKVRQFRIKTIVLFWRKRRDLKQPCRPLASHSRVASQIICSQHSKLWLLRFVKTSHCDVFTCSPNSLRGGRSAIQNLLSRIKQKAHQNIP